MFSIVKFKSDGSVQVVPTSWISKDKRKCRWPSGPNKNISSDIKKGKPASSNWPQLEVKVFKSADRYKEAKECEREATFADELDTTEGETTLKRQGSIKRGVLLKKARKERDSGEEGDDSSDSTFESDKEGRKESDLPPFNIGSVTIDGVAAASTPPPSTADQRQLIITNTQLEGLTSQHIPQVFYEGFQSQGIPLQLEFPSPCISQSVTLQDIYNRQIAFEKIAAKEFASIKADIQQLLCRTAEAETDFLELELPVTLPLKDEQDLVTLEGWVKADVQNFKKLVVLFRSLGGKTSQKVVSGILRRLLSKELACGINYIGAQGKVGFGGFQLRDVVIKSALRTNAGKDTSITQIVTFIQNWLRNARDLDGGKKTRTSKKTSNVLLSDEEEENQRRSY